MILLCGSCCSSMSIICTCEMMDGCRDARSSRRAQKMFGVFQKTCKSCKYYHHFKEDPKPNPDKTIPDNLIEMHWCEKGDFELLDLKRCPAYVNAAYTGYVVGFKGIEEFNRRRAALGRYILIKPPKG